MKHTITLLLLTATFTASGQWLTDSLIAHFPMDGTPNDAVAGLTPLTTSGAPSFCADRFGVANGAACFIGSSFWSYGDVLDMDTSDFSISLWYRVEGYTVGTQDHDFAVSKGTTFFGSPAYSGYSIGVRDVVDTTLTARCFGGDQESSIYSVSGPVAYHAWHHIVLSRCGGIMLMFIDAALAMQDTLAVGASLNTDIYLSIGAEDRSPTNQPDVGYFKGAIDDIRFYKGRCLSEAEIITLADQNVSIAEQQVGGNELRISPNPARSSVRLELGAPARSIGSVTLLNAMGQVVPLSVPAPITVEGRNGSLTLDISALPAGAYFVVVPTEFGSVHGRFIKD